MSLSTLWLLANSLPPYNLSKSDSKILVLLLFLRLTDFLVSNEKLDNTLLIEAELAGLCNN